MILNEYNSLVAVENQLSKLIAINLKKAIKANGIAKMLLSGGSTPKGLYQKLSKIDLDWGKVIIGLVDDRFVDRMDTDSNHRLIAEHLLINHACNAKFIGMVYDQNPKLNIKIVESIYEIFDSKIDVTLLGMGLDGHTASLFPTDAASQNALEDGFSHSVLNTIAAVEPIHRISCSKWFLHQSNHLYLMFSGAKKLAILETAKTRNLPIAHFFNTNKTELSIHYNL